jgi:hypothetical protein
MPYEIAWCVSELPDLDEVIDPLAGHVQELAPLLVLRSGVLPFLHDSERQHHNRSKEVLLAYYCVKGTGLSLDPL